jgi:Flp pilus assembly protein TadG
LNPAELHSIFVPGFRAGGRSRAAARKAAVETAAGTTPEAGRGSGRSSAGGRRSPRNGQSLAEFALILPVLLTLLGAAIDFARLYNVWINLEAATRDASEYVATCVNGSNLLLRCDGVGAATTAVTEAKRIVCTELGRPSNCTDPVVTVPTYTQDPSAAAGGSVNAPVTTAMVRASLTFRTIFPYPLLTRGGARTITIDRQYKIIQGR